MVSINVLIITYNQEKMIGRALDSVLRQKEWGLKEIVVCDDNSTDSNWDVIQSYVEKYPSIIRAYRNNPNLGIYGNVEKTYELRGEADLFVSLAGDDSFCNGYFEKAQNFITENHINLKDNAIAIGFDYAIIQPNGRRINISNSKIVSGNSLYRLKYRGLVSSRGLLISQKNMERYNKVLLDKGVPLAEHLCEIQGFEHADQAYYIPFVASVYYSQIGVSTTMKNIETNKNYIKRWDFFLSNGRLCKKDVYYTKFKKEINLYIIKPSLMGIIRIIRLFILSVDFSIGISWVQFIVSMRMIIRRSFLKW